MRPSFWVVIPAAGVGMRMGTDVPKQYLTLAGCSVLEHSLSHFISRSDIAGIVVAIASEDTFWPTHHFVGKETLHQVVGGADRSISVRNALRYLETLAKPNDWVLVHDAARPCLRQADLESLMSTLYDDPIGGILAVPVRDTIKCVSGSVIDRTVDREGMWLAQTPQMFRLGALAEALDRAFTSSHRVTDEASAMEFVDQHPRIVRGHTDNLKITHPEDLILAEMLLAHS